MRAVFGRLISRVNVPVHRRPIEPPPKRAKQEEKKESGKRQPEKPEPGKNPGPPKRAKQEEEEEEPPPLDLPAIWQSKIPLADFQVSAVRQILKARATVLCFATGNGKSLVAVTATQQLLLNNPALKIVVVAPLSLLENFRISLERYGVNRDHPAYSYYTYEGFAIEAIRKPDILQDKVVVYDEVHHIRTEVHTTLRNKHKAYVAKLYSREKPLTDAEKRYLKFEGDVKQSLSAAVRAGNVDPVHYVRSQTGVDISCIAPRSLIVVNASKKAFKIIGLTATPLVNGINDLSNLVSILRRENVYSTTFFKHHKYDSIKKGQFLFQDINPNDPDFPRLHVHNIDIEMDPNYYIQYHEVEMEVLSKKKSIDIENPWPFLNGMRRATQALEEAAKPRFALNIVLQNKKTLIFSVFKKHGIHTVRSLLIERRVPFVEITGDVKEVDRERAVNDFNNGNTNVALITAAGGEGT